MSPKKTKAVSKVLPSETIERKIYIVRGKRVILDSALAELYEVETRTLNQAVKRNIERFPMPDFMFQVTKEEFENLKSQFVTSRWGGVRKLPYVFTEQGVAMTSSVLNSKRAIQVNIQIIKTFVRLREMVMTHTDLKRKIEAIEQKMEKKFADHEQHFKAVFLAIEQLLAEPLPEPAKKTKKKRIGY